ncbi:MAG TPA: SMP-30/gluconolactonase/LRE family protein [Burkholderiales bacterium]|jgi:gluconolactonase|nr:SMP-30/gluconolactonase/LRE family protein [Burkholderiales bacterium]
MKKLTAVSRREVLKLAGAAGGLTIAAGLRSAWAQSAPRIERLDPALDRILSTSQPVRELGSGYGGAMGPAEGPVWWKEGGYLLFNDIHNDRRHRYTPGQGVTLVKQGVNRANGLTRDLQGRLISCEHDSRRVTREELDGSLTVVANQFQGRRLSRPNDVIVKSDGCMFFTDPNHNLVPEQWDIQLPGVYRVTPDLGTMTLISDNFAGPNGLAFSPDESLLYINDVRRRHIRVFNVQPNGMPARESDRIFADLGGAEPGSPDGMKVDVEGNVYCGGSGGLYVMDAKGKKLGRIAHGQPATTNMAFGGDDWKTLYFTTRTHLFSVNVNVAGLPVPVQARKK